jgi:hypothetical protein
MGTFLALTSNGEVNLVLAQRAVEEFQPPRVVAFFEQGDQSNTTANKAKISQAFAGGFSVKIWNDFISEQRVKLGKSALPKAEEFEQKVAYFQSLIETNELLPLLIRRGDKQMVLRSLEELKPDDELIYLLHDPRPQLLKRLSGGMQSRRLTLEELAVVENFEWRSPTTPTESQEKD